MQFKNIINDEFFVSERLYSIINSGYSFGIKICEIILNTRSEYFSKEMNYLDVDSKGMISYLPTSKIKEVIGEEQKNWETINVKKCFESKSRVTIKAGRFIRKFFTNYLTKYSSFDEKVEIFVNYLKQCTDESSYFEIVEGDDILKYYNHNNYFSIDGQTFGSLGNSCMKKRTSETFRLYANNCKMLCLFSDIDGVKKLKGRALLWDNVTVGGELYDGNSYDVIENVKFMDRPYTYFDHDLMRFINWADTNGYIRKTYQNHTSPESIYINQQDTYMPISVKLNLDNVIYFPYMDTFKYGKSNRDGSLSNFYKHKDVVTLVKDDYSSYNETMKLENTDGIYSFIQW